MTVANYVQCLAWVLEEEGGFVNHPRDPGGATNKGVTQRVYDDWRAARGLVAQSVRLIAPSEIQGIYSAQYWTKVAGDKLPSGLDYAMFDFAVNSGPNRATRFLQQLLGADADGQIGPKTLAAIPEDAKDLAAQLTDKRLAFLRTLPTFDTFGRGWTTRCNNVKRRVGAMT